MTGDQLYDQFYAQLHEQARALIGKIVTLKKGGDGRTAIVVYAYKTIPGGVRLDAPLNGIRSWNIGELELV
jgi:hypothetical protein